MLPNKQGKNEKGFIIVLKKEKNEFRKANYN
jgi:hypothetical protein